MKSIKTLYKIGYGPSSSHTMGPEQACLLAKQKYNNIKDINVTLYGSLALTGVGHLTDKVIKKTIDPIACNIEFDYTTKQDHANTFKFEINLDNNEVIIWHIISIGGGDIIIKELPSGDNDDSNTYSLTTFNEFKQLGSVEDIIDYLFKTETDLDKHLEDVYNTMIDSVNRGLSSNEEVLPGKLKLKRQAKTMNRYADTKELMLSSYAQAVSEENASGGQIVTAPTCGACGIIPAIIYFYEKNKNLNHNKIIRGLALAGLLGTLIRHNGSISGAEAGCQAEVGSATSMGAALISYFEGKDVDEIECSAVIGLEHQLGLTCDPVLGYVQLPCINRNAMGVVKAYMASKYASSIKQHTFSFDQIVKVMYETGKDLNSNYRETSLGGLAKMYDLEIKEDEN